MLNNEEFLAKKKSFQEHQLFLQKFFTNEYILKIKTLG